MNKQNILDAIDNLANITAELKKEVQELKKVNTELSGKLRLLSDQIDTL